MAKEQGLVAKEHCSTMAGYTDSLREWLRGRIASLWRDSALLYGLCLLSVTTVRGAVPVCSVYALILAS